MTDDMKMHPKMTIIFPSVAGMDVLAMDHATNQRGSISLRKAQEVITGAVINDDMVTKSQDFNPIFGVAIVIFDKGEVERIEKLYAEKGLLP